MDCALGTAVARLCVSRNTDDGLGLHFVTCSRQQHGRGSHAGLWDNRFSKINGNSDAPGRLGARGQGPSSQEGQEGGKAAAAS